MNKTDGRNVDKGYTLLELIFVMALLTMFGITAVTLVISGSKAYNAIIAVKNDNAEIRIASSYINMKIRQNDLSGNIRVTKSPVGQGAAVVIEEKAGSAVYETWIYWDSGKLREGYIEQGDTLRNEISFTIAEIDGFSAEYDAADRNIDIGIWIIRDGKTQNRDSTIHLRTGV
jgi:type II secretory pathway pseudopilin PulG